MTYGYIGNDDSGDQDRTDTEMLLPQKEVLTLLYLAISISAHSAGTRKRESENIVYLA